MAAYPLVISMYQVGTSSNKLIGAKYAKIASAYLDVQNWAKDNTLKETLFMPDPSHFYGWRDFSERSSFGNLREWGYTAIAYYPALSEYNKGKKRMAEFGIKIDEITEAEIKNSKKFNYGLILSDEIRKVFYEMKPKSLQKISQKYKINYIIMKKEFHK